MIEILQSLNEKTGESFRRLIPVLGLARSSVMRWSGRLRRGRVAVRKRGPAKAPLHNPQMLATAIAALPHRAHRTLGTTGLWRTWRTMISRRDFNARIREERHRRQRELRDGFYRLVWTVAGGVWAMDPAEYRDHLWNMVVDLASRYRFELKIATTLPAGRIVEHLRQLFDRYGPPLFLKRDNGSNLVASEVNELITAYGVIPLTSPPYYPRYNGAVEYAQRETKHSARCLEAAGMSRDHALSMAPQLLNAHPRPCLGGRTAQDVLYTSLPSFHQMFTPQHRKEIKYWIENRTETILGQMKSVGQYAHDAAWRQAVETWLLDNRFIEVVQPKLCYPNSHENGLK